MYGDYTFCKDLKTGAFGSVFIAEKDKTQYVLKFIAEPKDEALMEIKVLQDLVNVKGVVQYVEHFYLNESIVIVYKYFSSYDLFDYLQNHGPFTEYLGLYVFKQLCQIIDNVHKRGIVHRDIKPENILIDNNYNILLIDWGLAFYPNETEERIFCGSPNYAAPEIINLEIYNGPELDVWSMGCLLYTLLTCKMAFDADNMTDLFDDITVCKVDLTLVSIRVSKILTKIFVRENRISVQDLLKELVF